MTGLDNLTDHGPARTLADKRAALSRRRREVSRRSYPVSPAQERLWFLDRLMPGNTAYNIPLTARLRGRIDRDRWARAMAMVIERHEALRTTFSEQEGQPVQVVHATMDTPFEFVDGSEQALDPAAAAHAQHTRPFDLGTGPLMRFRLIRLSDEEHILMWTVHHIVADLWSTAILLGDLIEAYTALGEGRPANFPHLPIQYADYAVWQHSQPDNGATEADCQFWTDHLAGAPTVLDLPLDHPRPRVQSTRGASVPIRLSEHTTARLREIARSQRATPFMAILACYQVFLHRWVGEDDLVVGVAVANRTRPEVERLIGYFANELALRADLSGGPSFGDYVRRVRQAWLGALAHQSLPFNRVVELVQPDRDLSRTPLFQASFIYQSIPLPDLRSTGLILEPMPTRSTGARFDLELQLFEGPEIAGTLDYNADLFDPRTAESMARHFEALVETLCASPDASITDVPLCTPDDLTALRSARAAAQRDWAGPRHLPQLFAKQAAAHPTQTAVADDTRTLSYAQLDQESARLANVLCARGVGRGTLVGVCLDRDAELLITLLAILRTGAAYLPLDPDFPPDRLAFIVANSRVRVVISRSGPGRGVADSEATTLLLEDIADELRSSPAQAPDPATTGTDLAYVIYTSGSTGHPKGVAIAHEALGNFLLSMAERPGFTEQDRLLAVTTLSFDIAGLELFLPLVAGGSVVITGRDDVRDPARLVRKLGESGATVLQATPALWRMVFEGGWRGDGALTALVGGEALPADLAAQLLQTVGSAWNMYGPTETTIWSSTWQLERGAISLGDPIANTDFVIVDRHHRPVPPGVPGELLIGGVGLAEGYLHRPDLTAERFVPHPLEPGRLAYRTGDVVRVRADGSLEYQRRLDNQIKLRGYRIELGEIESRLLERPEVSEAVVVLVDDAASAARLVAYVVPSGHIPDTESHALIATWQSVWDDAYSQDPGVAAGGSADDDFRGWRSSLTGAPIPSGDMREWADATADSIRSLGPRRLLEIGCGSGLLLRRLAPDCAAYVGIDASENIVRSLRTATADLPGVAVHSLRADQLAALPETATGFDTIVLNSVVQYFPTEQYLLDVLADAIAVLTPGGRVFVGDVRSLPLLRAFHTAVGIHSAPAGQPIAELLAAIERGLAEDEELVIDPAFFSELPDRDERFQGIGVRVTPKPEQADTEMARYRYDVVLELGAPTQTPSSTVRSAAAMRRLDLPDAWQAADGNLVITGVANPRLAQDVAVAKALPTAAVVEDLRSLPLPEVTLSVADIKRFGAERGLTVAWDFSRHDSTGNLTAVLGIDPAAVTTLAAARPGAVHGESRVHRSAHRLGRIVAPGLRAHLRSTLPDYMLPADLVFLADLPHTPNGKIDRKALPTWSTEEPPATRIAPADALEERLCALASEILGREHVGPLDSFFDLGGHSLLATRLTARVRTTEGVEVPVRAVFEHPTMRALADQVRSASVATIPRLEPFERPPAPPLSYAQQRLWFLHEFEGPTATYNIPMAINLPGVDPDLLALAIRDVVDRHETLRTLFGEADGMPHQVVLAAAPAGAELVVREVHPDQLRAAIDRATRHPFNLTTEIPFRAELLLAGPTDRVLVLTIHHVACDGWSLVPLQRDLAAAYEARQRGSAPAWSPLPVQYVDFALWQRQLLGDRQDPRSRVSRQLDYWRRNLDGIPEALDLATDRPRPTRSSGDGEQLDFEFTAATMDAIRRLSQRGDATDAMIVVATLAVLLSRMGAGKDLPIGLDISSRPDPALDELVGFFVNTLVIRADLDADPAFLGLLDQVRSHTLGALDNAEVPFEMLVEALNPQRSMAHHPLIQILVAWQSFPDVTAELPGGGAEVLPTSTGTARMDLCVTMTEHHEGSALVGLTGNVEFNTDIFDPATIRTMLHRWQHVIVQLAARPDLRISEVELVGAEERDRLLAFGRGPEEPEQLSLVDLLARTTARHPERAAVVSGHLTLTYRELDEASERLARALVGGGTEPGDVVAIIGHSSVAAIAASVAVLRAGAAYLPLDPDLPPERLQHLLRDSGATVVLGHRSVVTALPWLGGPGAVPRLLALGDAAGLDAPVEGAWDSVLPTPAPDDPAYLVYTSGSTGEPKGVVGPHRGVSVLARHLAALFDATPGTTVLQFAAFNFDTSLSDIWTAFAGGATLAVPDAPHRELDIAGFVRTHGVTHAHLTPSVLRALSREDLEPVRHLVTGGEACSPDLVARWAPGRIFRNSYGPTETAVTMTVSEPLVPAAEPPYVGDPIPGTTMYLLDERHQPVPPGVVGELYITGACLTDGYLNRPDLTRERFVPDPFMPGRLMYRSGDLFRWTREGRLVFGGRVDQQLKIRGYRVEPGEIQHSISQFPGVHTSVVLARTDHGTARLVAYVVPQEGAVVDPIGLRSHLADSLPSFMIPSAIMQIPQLPLTSRGKLDRRALPDPDATARPTLVGPVTASEQVLCEIVGHLLGLPEVSTRTSFFDLGGDSIQAIQLASRAKTAGVPITTHDVFQHPTIAELAAVGDSTASETHAADADPTGTVPPTVAAESLRALGVPTDDVAQSVVITVPAGAARDRLSMALGAVRRQHPLLGARLAVLPEGPWTLEVPLPEEIPGVELPVIDAAGQSDNDVRGLIDGHLAIMTAGLDPQSGEMMAAALVVREPEAAALLICVIHHLVVDAASWPIILDDLAHSYHGGPDALAGRPGSSPFRAWAEFQQELARSTEVTAELDRWVGLLDAMTPLTSARHSPRGGIGAFTTRLRSDATSALLRDLPTAFGAGTHEMLVATFGTALQRWHRDRGGSGTPGLAVETHGRQPEAAPGLDLSRSVGWFTSIHPVVVQAPLSWTALMAAGSELDDVLVRAVAELAAVPVSGSGFGLLSRLNPVTAPILGRGGGPQVLFNYLGRHRAVTMTEHFIPLGAADAEIVPAVLAYPLEMNAFVLDDEDGPTLVVSMAWARNLFTSKEIERLAESWFRVLEAAIRTAQRPGRVRPAAVRRPAIVRSVKPIPMANRSAALPLSFSQLEMFCQSVDPSSAHHNVITASRLLGSLDPDAFEAGLDALVARHEALGVRFTQTANGWVQHLDPNARWHLTRHDLRELHPSERDRRLADLVTRHSEAEFDLAAGPLVRGSLVRLADQETAVILAMHHAAVDPWAVAVLTRELPVAYDAIRAGAAPQFPPLPVNYLDVAAWQQDRLGRGELDESLAHWRSVFADLPPRPTFTVAAEPRAVEPRAAESGPTRGMVLGEQLTRRVYAGARSTGVTPFTFLLAAFQTLIALSTDTVDVSVSYPTAGREDARVQDSVGYFINTVVVRSLLDVGATFAHVIAQAKEGVLAANRFQEVPLRHLHGRRDPDVYDPFRISFNLVNYEDSPLRLPGLRTEPLGLRIGDEEFIPELITAMQPHNLDLYLIMHEHEQQLHGLWLWHPDRVPPAAAEALIARWPVLLERLAHDPGLPLTDVFAHPTAQSHDGGTAC